MRPGRRLYIVSCGHIPFRCPDDLPWDSEPTARTCPVLLTRRDLSHHILPSVRRGSPLLRDPFVRLKRIPVSPCMAESARYPSCRRLRSCPTRKGGAHVLPIFERRYHCRRWCVRHSLRCVVDVCRDHGNI